ncbi:MAG: hypothetical protein L0210_04310 [Rhodospirillales bacterium]|nr:hypothetical protein [Rhodospirillales bacterium]
MSAAELEVFDRTLQDTNIWLGEIMDAVGGEIAQVKAMLPKTVAALWP